MADKKTIDFISRGVRLQKQDQLAWCYAAVVSILTNWLSTGNGWDPCQIAGWALWNNKFKGADLGEESFATICNCCKKKDKPHACTTAEAVSPLKPVLDHLSVTYNRMKGPPSLDTIVTEIDADRPVILELLKDGGAGHVCLVIGYEYRELKNTQGTKVVGQKAIIVMYDPAANVLPGFKHDVDLRTMSFEVAFVDLLGKYPTEKHRVGYYYKNLILNGSVTAAPDWAVFKE